MDEVIGNFLREGLEPSETMIGHIIEMEVCLNVLRSARSLIFKTIRISSISTMIDRGHGLKLKEHQISPFSSFKPPNLGCDGSIQALYNGFARSLHSTGQTSKQAQQFHHPQNFRAASPVINQAVVAEKKAKSKVSRTSMILWCSHQNDSAAMQKLLEEDQSLVHARDYDNRTPLHVTSLHGWTDVAKCLIEYGADVNAQDRWKNTPLADAEGAKKKKRAMIENATYMNSGKIGKLFSKVEEV
ncbi:Potassium channel KOR1 [Camellia lanceoleosa]|uniref:Potassium channel KOR1 n=1 Tax=Camellia lanceoleosa TaxID=1840588 RepID=A0ACC0G9J8_9ERIC|nr:Potassium channel KOR1 [Camellia lanceoleosa]